MVMNIPAYPLNIEGHPARIELDVNAERQYHWRMRCSTRFVEGAARSPEDAIAQMEAIASPPKVK